MKPGKTSERHSAERSTKVTVPSAHAFDTPTMRKSGLDGTIHSGDLGYWLLVVSWLQGV